MTKKLIGLLFTLSACGGPSAKDSVTAHSVGDAALIGAESIARAPGPLVVISGKVQDCSANGEEIAVQTFPVKAFDPASNSKLVGLLRSSDTLTYFSGPPASRARANEEYDQLARLFTTATALALDSTSSTGSYSLTVPSMDSVLILGFEEREDVPEYYQYYMVSGRSNVSVMFDMAGGACSVHQSGPRSDSSSR